MESTLVLYDVEFTADKNYIVDLISDYLQYRPHQKVISNFQLIKLDNFLSIKINLDDEGLDFQNLGYNYVEITNIDNNGDGNGTYYYFIDKVRYESPKTVLLELIFDDLNTFNAMHLLDLTDRTYVKREHRDRFYNDLSRNAYSNKVDRVDEGVYPSLVRTATPTALRRDYQSLSRWDFKWYLIIQKCIGSGDSDKIYTSFIPEKDIAVKINGQSPNITIVVAGINRYSFTDSETFKVIELPYNVLPIHYVDTRYIHNDWAIQPLPDGNYMYFEADDGEIISIEPAVNLTLFDYVNVSINFPLSYYKEHNILDLLGEKKIYDYEMFSKLRTTINPTDRTLHSSTYETKLKNSNFYKTKFAYDSFSLEIKYENLEYTGTDDLEIKFRPSMFDSIGLFSFNFEDFNLISDEDYNVLVYKRKNEVPLFNDAYLNYMRNGYNYDVKAKNLSLASNLIGGASSIGTGVALGSMGNTMGSAKGIIGGSSSIVNAGFEYLNKDNQIFRNQKEAMAKGISISGVDDLELFHTYGIDGKLLVYQYHLDDEAFSQLYNLFRLKGYNTNQYKVPDVESRRNYNYLECVPDFKYIYDSRLINYKNSLISKFNEGVYFIHQCEHDGDIEYDFYMKYENWELWLLPRS